MSTKANARKNSPTTAVAASPELNWVATIGQIKNDKLSVDEIIHLADKLSTAGKLDLIDVAYQTWLVHSSSPMKCVIAFNYGVLLANWGRVDDAIRNYNLALQLNPAFPHPHINLGLALERQGKQEDAVKRWQLIEQSDLKDTFPLDIRTTALNHIGRLRELQRNYIDAEAALTQSLEINPNQKDALHHWFHLRQKQCNWPVMKEFAEVTKNKITTSMSPLACLAHEDDLGFQLYIADRINREKFTFNHQPMTGRKKYGHRKIRLGYLSGDLCTHAIGLIMPEIFELHDRSRYEIYLYDYGREDGTALRSRYKQNIENFISIAEMTDAQAAAKIRMDEIDILIDLHGLSLGIRAEVLAFRPAPIQMTYLGYIGTTMMPSIDYVITDEFCFTNKMEQFYSEAPLKLRHSCLPTDRKKVVDPTPQYRELAGLPNDKFIFATFNNSYKLNEKMFSTWLRIMKRVPNSVLWIVDDNPWATSNIRKFTDQNGVDPGRLIFTPRVAPPTYLARMPLADLFLDNHPYNAGSTASDILWMGVPMITLSGETFVSRMAGSLLHYAGLSELITSSHSEYENLAVALSADPDRLMRIKSQMLNQRNNGGSFDMSHFTQELERLYEESYNKLEEIDIPVNDLVMI
jgi:predicted O-linked N-acetylglucosamine transferase (SPINDLY family)